MKKHLVLIFTIISFFIFNTNIQAKEIYYTNEKGVEFTKDEYDFLSFMFWDGSQELMNIKDYYDFISSNIMNGNIAYDEYEYSQYYRATDSEDNNKNLKIVSSCNSDCTISVVATWKTNPGIRSYDVIGARLENTSIISGPSTVARSNNGNSMDSSEIKKYNNGFGVSIQLPRYGNSLTVSQTYRVERKGSVYASYQHALQNITLANSKNYTISSNGYGGVFSFSGIAVNIYDKMPGVNISL